MTDAEIFPDTPYFNELRKPPSKYHRDHDRAYTRRCWRALLKVIKKTPLTDWEFAAPEDGSDVDPVRPLYKLYARPKGAKWFWCIENHSPIAECGCAYWDRPESLRLHRLFGVTELRQMTCFENKETLSVFLEITKAKWRERV